MKRLKEILFITGICLSIAGCGSAEESVKKAEKDLESSVLTGETVDGVHETEKFGDKSVWEEELMWKEINYLEDNFGLDMKFETMDSQLAAAYGEELGEYYDFIGRITEDGYGYVLAFQNGNENPFEGNEQYWIEHDFVVVKRDENTSEETTIFSLSKIENIYQGQDHLILYLQPEDMEEPEELENAFIHRYCNGEEGVQYLQDVIQRGVRLTPPDSGAYLVVYRYENGKHRQEYVCLTDEEELEILSSDALILPEWYGEYGLQLFVSSETYEETDMEQGPITDAALKIAEERCRYAAMDISEIKDIAEADFRMKVEDENGDLIEIAIDVTDEKILKELEEILSSAEVAYEGKCPYNGILTLTRADGKELVLSLATDSCDGFIFGSNGIYTVGKEKTKRIWEIFSEAGKYTGWTSEDEYAAK